MASALIITSGELAALLGAELHGPDDIRLSGLASLESAGADDLSFVRDSRFAARLVESKAGAVLVSRTVLEHESGAKAVAGAKGRAFLIVNDADLALVMLLERVAARTPLWVPEVGIPASARVDSTARIGRDVRIGAGVSIGAGTSVGDGTVIQPNAVLGAGVEVGSGCVIHPNVTILDRCRIGREVVLWPGVVLGADGFGYRPSPDGKGVLKIPHVGTVELGDRVEIGANTSIDRGKFGATSIGMGTKIDNHVQIGHNCVIGRWCVICGCCAIAGSVVIEDGVTMGGGATISDNVRVGAGTQLGARTGVMADVPPGSLLLGTPARPARETLRLYSMIGDLPEVLRQFRKGNRPASPGGARRS